ncbi:copper resistance system multicopper oxidase [Thiohalobacter sp.]|uniref:copper resistance system multicopper oxidase n=1 Tax=Thiohalobacter sp. TaxID=2025948 RepID=UPI002620C814|nr:copper resistance system multicopper oxidase [Thiohalobacter sp.]
MKRYQASDDLPDRSRRRFIEGLAAGGLLLSLPGRAWPGATPGAAVTGNVPVLSGTEFDLVISETLVNFTGRPRMATTINGSIPGPILRWREGDTVTLRVTNRLPVSTSIHWHGIILPYQMDGVPGVSFPGIAPGETFVYRFRVQQSGTYWYHSHTGFQEQTGMYGTIIIDPADGPRIRADRDYVVQLSDWTDEDPMDVFARLKKQSDYYNFNQPTLGDFLRDVSERGWSEALARRRMWNRMRMSPTDLADISAYTYTYLMNGTPPAGNWTALFKSGERVRLRFISSGTQSFFDVRIPGLKMTLVHVDGQDVEPVTIDEFRCGPGETYDVIVEPEDRAYTLYAQSMDRTGYARGTLAPRPGMSAPVPEPDPPQWLGMVDMMGAMAQGGMGHGAMSGMDHGAQGGMGGGGTHAMHGGMSGMHDMAGMGGMSGMPRARHARTEYGPSVDMRVDYPRTNLDDPGVGLRDNGRRVLTYADIHTLGGPLDARDAEREIELHLTGNMERYTWSLDGLEFGRSTPVHFRYNERLRVVLVNDTMMTHPMHLHGMWSELEQPGGGFLARRHTISVQPAQRVSFLVTADALGRWAWHCHLLYHMDAGMFREVVVS